MTISELEIRLKKHAEITKSVITTPLFTERMKNMTNRKKSFKKTAILIAAVILLIGTTVYAALGLLSAKETAANLGDTNLAEYFSKQGGIFQTAEDEKYKATVLGIASGENLSNFKSSSWEIFPERTYVVVAIEKKDRSKMTYDDEILVTPLISGLSPWQYNIFTMNGGYVSDIIDGVLYRIIEFDSIEYFADRNVYIAVLSEAFLNNKSYSFNEATGEITANSDYSGTNLLIVLPLDKAKANPEAAQKYLDTLRHKEKNSNAQNDDFFEDDTVEFNITPEMIDEALNNR